MTTTQATVDDRERWDNYVNAHPRAESYHRFDWCDIFESVFGNDCHYLMVEENGSIRGVLPLVHLKSLLFGDFLISVPCFNYAGILADDRGSAGQLLDAAWALCKELGASHVELRHSRDERLDLPARTEKVAMRLPLPGSPDELWTRFKPKLRAQIRRPKKENAVCEVGGIELLDEFYSVFSRNMRDLGTPVFPKSLFQAVIETFPTETWFSVVRLGGEACAAGFMHGYRDRLEIPSASSLRSFNRLSVNMLLYWSVLEFAIEQGYSVFDFGRSTVDSGTFRFKRQWGAEPTELKWDYRLADGEELPELNPDNPKFKIATGAWRRLPLAIANWLGPKIVRGLP